MENMVFELTAPQKSIYYTEQFFENLPINNICGSFIIKQKINVELLQKSVNLFIKNNDSFNLRFKNIEGKISQYFTEPQEYIAEIINVEKESDIEKIATEMVNTKFDILNSYPFTFKIFILPSGFGGVIGNIHHLISDAATYSIVATEMVQIYSKLLKNEEIIPKTYFYKDYINSEKEYLSSDRFKKDKEYWNEVLTPIPEVATIPIFENRDQKNNTYECLREELIIDNSLLTKIKEFCLKNNVSLFNFLVGVYSIYIGRINNMDKFLLGTPILNRSNYAEKHTSGMFISTSLLNIDMSTNCSFIEFLHNTAKTSMSMLRHQKYNYQYIIEDLRKKDNSISNLYDVVLSYQITKATDTTLDIPYTTKWYGTKYSANTLAIHFHDNNDTGNLLIEYDYQIAKLSRDTINKIHNSILTIITSVLENSTQTIQKIEIITPEEKNKILYEFNNRSLEYPKDKTIIDIFEENVKKYPENDALIYKDITYSYSKLNKKVNQFARFLKDSGVNPKDFVGVYMNKTEWFIISILAVQKLGAAYVPMHPDYPEERVKYILEDCNASILISDNDDFKLEHINPKNIELNAFDDTNINVKINSLDMAYVIYTSGSTGKPKGVAISHRNLLNFLYNENDSFKLKFRPEDNCLSVANISFDASVQEIFTPFCFGATLVLYSKNTLTNIPILCDILEKKHITYTFLPPNILDDIFEFIYKNNRKFYINKLSVGVESIKNSTLNNFYKLNQDIEIINGYGPSEATICSTFYRHEYNENKSQIVPIGYPLKNNDIYILNKFNTMQPIGVKGELCISGDSVSNGYLNNTVKTQESFVKMPKYQNRVFYKTGDIAYFDSEGCINFIGRQDSQIKFRGHRIELNEINNNIKNIDEVNNSITLLNNLKGIPSICSYVTVKNSSLTDQLIKNKLESILPYYMIPNHIIILEQLPINKNGKIDKTKLPKTDLKSDTIVLPSTPTEKFITNTICKILNIKNISIDDEFFAMGLDSLAAIRLSTEIYNSLKINISIRNIFQSNTIRNLSKFIDKSTYDSNFDIIKKCEEKEFYKISSAQKRIYFASKIAGNNSILYNVPGGVIIDGNIDLNKLEKCINTIINRHESLRTYFELNDTEVVQKIIDKYEFKLDILENVDFKNLDSLFNEFVKPFDLATAPLFRVKAILFTNGKSAIFIDMHHIISDGTSLSIFTDEISKLYNGESLENLDITYKDFAEYENEMITSDYYKMAEEYWLNRFKDELPVLNLPTNYSRPANKTYQGFKIYSCIDELTTKKLEELANTLSVTPYMFLIACYYILLYRYTSQEDIVVGSPIVGRDMSQTYNLIGMFVNTLALRNKIDSQSSFKDFLYTIKENMLDAYKYQTYPFDELVNKLNISRDNSRNPLFDTMFTYQNNGYKKLEFNGLNTSYYIPDTNISKFDLSVEAVPTDNKINLSFEYATDLFSKDFITQISSHYINILHEVLENLETKISDIQMISNEERDKILYEFNNTKVDYPRDKTIVDLFEKQVEKTPNNIAVVFENQKLTYKELNEKANSLAYVLREKAKIEPNDLIGIMVNRSLEMIVSILAVLKSGGAYIPIDPTYPEDRINYMLESSNAKLLLTQKHLESKLDFKNKIFVELNNEFYLNNTTNLKHINSPEDLSYVIFTSGSTGKPKGVMLMHKNIVNFIFGMSNIFNFSAKDTIASITTISFDIFVLESLYPLSVGAKIIIANEEMQVNVDLFNKLCTENNVNIFQTTPSRIQAFLNSPYIDFVKKATCILIGGEPFPPTLLDNFKKITNAKIYNMYGPTETAVWSSCNQLNESSEITIGKPIINTKFYILNKNLMPLPYNVPGDIYISGDGVSKGYLKNSELTNKVFINNPFEADSIIYTTGDIGLYKENGEIVCLGRSDNQIKLRGLRIELGEIESAINSYTNILKSVVIKHTINNKEFLCCYFITEKNIDINNLKKYLSGILPKYMLPSYFIALSNFPYTPNGKLDKKALPTPKELISVDKTKYVEPKTILQKELVNIYENTLNIKPIGINDNFFELGGDSLLAINLNMELLKISNKITYQDIFNYPTVAEMEEKIISNNNELQFKKIENLSYKHLEVLKNSRRNDVINIIHPKGILLTGATGFLGIHILKELIENEKCKIYCIVRDNAGIPPITRLQHKLNYYFGNKYDNLINDRIIVVSGDTTKPSFGLQTKELHEIDDSVDIVINSAAIVSHFGIYEKLYNANVRSVKYLIDFCNTFNKKLYHISTIGISGLDLDRSYMLNKKIINFKKNTKICFNESNLYIGQNLENVYIRSKFEAENLLLDEIPNGLDAYILRMGHLTSRFSDGVFQENVLDNNLINKFISFIKIGYLPDYIKDFPIEFTPVDDSANAIYKIITHQSENNRIFHLYNPNILPARKILKLLKKSNLNISVIDEKSFTKKINDLLQDENSKKILNNLLYDFDNNFKLNYENNIIISATFTNNYLKKCHFKWHKLTKTYLTKLFDIIRRSM